MHGALRAGKLPANGFYLRNKKGQKGDGSAARRVAAPGRASLLIARPANKGQQERPPAQVRTNAAQGLAKQRKGKPQALQAALPGDKCLRRGQAGRFSLPE